MPTRLSDMEYDEVSLVDSGANQDAHVVLFKRDKGATRIKKTAYKTCSECDARASADDEKCPECGGTSLKKSVRVVRTTVEKAEDDSAENETHLVDAEEDDEEDESDDDDESEDEEDEEDEDESDPVDVPEEVVGKASEVTLDLTYGLAKSIEEILKDSSTNRQDAYEQVMVEFNQALDQAAGHWFAGKSVSKSAKIAKSRIKRLEEMRNTLTHIIGKEGSTMPELDEDTLKGLDPKVTAYIAELKEAATKAPATVEKKDDTEEDIFKGMSPAVVAIVKKAQADADTANAELAKRADEAAEKEFIAKAATLGNLPINPNDFGKVLKAASESLSEEQFNSLQGVLQAADYNLKQNGIFKSFGSTQPGTQEADISKIDAQAASLVEKGEFPTIEQAQAHLFATNPALYHALEGSK